MWLRAFACVRAVTRVCLRVREFARVSFRLRPSACVCTRLHAFACDRLRLHHCMQAFANSCLFLVLHVSYIKRPLNFRQSDYGTHTSQGSPSTTNTWAANDTINITQSGVFLSHRKFADIIRLPRHFNLFLPPMLFHFETEIFPWKSPPQ